MLTIKDSWESALDAIQKRQKHDLEIISGTGNAKELILFAMDHLIQTAFEEQFWTLIFVSFLAKKHSKIVDYYLQDIVSILIEFLSNWTFQDSTPNLDIRCIISFIEDISTRIKCDLVPLLLGLCECLSKDVTTTQEDWARYMKLSMPFINFNKCMNLSQENIGFHLALYGKCEYLNQIPIVFHPQFLWSTLEKLSFQLPLEESKNKMVIDDQLNLLCFHIQRVPHNGIEYDGFEVTNTTCAFLERLYMVIVSGPSQETSISAYKLLDSIVEKMTSESKTHTIMKMITSSLFTLEMGGLELLKKCIHNEFIQQHPKRYFTTTFMCKTFYPIIFELDSSLYKNIQHTNSNILQDDALFVEKIDTLMRVLNFYRYLSLREIKNTFGIMDKDQKNDIRRLFMDKIVKRTKQVLLDLQSDSKLQKDIMKDQGKEYLNDCISKVQLLDMTIVLVYF